jgi:hypothetical protein
MVLSATILILKVAMSNMLHFLPLFQKMVLSVAQFFETGVKTATS